MTKRDEAPTTYQAFAELDDPLPGGRFASIEPRSVTGSAPTYDAPRQPEGSPWLSDVVGPEPPLGYDISAAPDLGWPEQLPSSLPCAAAERGSRVPVPTVERGSPANLKRRRRMP
jgi:hypothetical protein